eukprot:m.97446 g.97446  ORF g.97446 m.97446 type:complete len:59 (+) comp16697_c0_seq10:1518-1694(+)
MPKCHGDIAWVPAGRNRATKHPEEYIDNRYVFSLALASGWLTMSTHVQWWWYTEEARD